MSKIYKKFQDDPVYILSKSLEIKKEKLEKILNRVSVAYGLGLEENISISIVEEKLFSLYYYSMFETKKTKEKIQNFINSNSFKRYEEYESCFEKSGKCAYFYAKFVLKNRFENESKLFLNKFDISWLYEYYQAFFREEVQLPEIQHNFMIMNALTNGKDYIDYHYAQMYLAEYALRKNQKEDAINMNLIKKAFLNFLQNNDATKDIKNLEKYVDVICKTS